MLFRVYSNPLIFHDFKILIGWQASPKAGIPWSAEHIQEWEEVLWRACFSLLSPTGFHGSCRKFTTDIGYGKNNECLQKLWGGLGHCIVPKTVCTLPSPPPQNGIYYKIAVVLLCCRNLTFNRLVTLCTKRQSKLRKNKYSVLSVQVLQL